MMEAIFEVYTDMIVEQTGSPDKALLWVLKQDYKEFCVSSILVFCCWVRSLRITAIHCQALLNVCACFH